MVSRMSLAVMFKLLTGILKVQILAVESFGQAVNDYPQLHYLLAYYHVWFGDVDFKFRVVDLTGKAITHHLRQVPGSDT